MHKKQDGPDFAGFFTKDVSASYDAKNRNLAPIVDNLHFLIRLVLKDLPRNARILCVGVGTGAEILSLSGEYPEWSFVGVEPSSPMLDVCRERLRDAGVLNRCELIHGYVQDAPAGENFDAVLSILVAHFVKRAERPDFYRNIQERLKTDGYFISAEISCDLDSDEFPLMLENWKHIQKLMGAAPEQLESLASMLRETLPVLSPTETETLIRASGIPIPVRFYQAFMISGWYGKKVHS